LATSKNIPSLFQHCLDTLILKEKYRDFYKPSSAQRGTS